MFCYPTGDAELPVPTHFLTALSSGGALEGLKKPTHQEIVEMHKEFPALSTQYFEFVSEIGIGRSLHSGVAVDLPYWLADELVHSGHVAIGPALQKVREAFGAPKRPKAAPLRQDVVVVSDSGASWRYCMLLNGDPSVYTYDFYIKELEPTHPDFFSFIQSQLDYASPEK